ncbi:PepSY domain-containing protein [Aeromonas cavernicola]|nr:PepSY domain-containing protein [Aeromonas cavernicola]
MNMISRCVLLTLLLLNTAWANPHRLDMAALVKLLLAQGYHDIREIELEGETFEVKTLNRQDQTVSLIVDAHTGEIKQQTTK